MTNPLLILCCMLCLGITVSPAQTFKADTLFRSVATASQEKVYLTRIRGQSQLYNGSDFDRYEPLKEEHPYLYSDDWMAGSVVYDGIRYENLSLQYDIRYDEVILEYFNGISIRLVKVKVQSFTLEQHTFVHLSDPQVGDGYYELLYDGTTKVYAKHLKLFQETAADHKIERWFVEKTRYYVWSQGTYHTITSKKTLLGVFGDKKKELNQFASRNKLSFGKNKASFITRVAEQYDSQ